MEAEMTDVITLTEAAKKHIVNTLVQMNKPYLVFGIQGGGCAGFEYFWQPADEELYARNGSPDLDQFIDLGQDKKLVVDHTGLVYLLGSVIDYKTDFISSQLVVENPAAKSSCGCGTSISF
jgi:iron-sulfur cluster assembly protein